MAYMKTPPLVPPPIEDPYKMLRLRSIMGRPGPMEPQRPPVEPQVTLPRPFARPGTDIQAPAVQRMRGQMEEPEPLSEDSQYFDEYSRLAGNRPATSAYKAALLEQPRREDHAPGWWGRIAASLTGAAAGYRDPASGVSAARDVIETPYRRAMEDYATKVEALRRGADIEQEELDSQVRGLSTARALGLRYAEFDERRRRGQNQDIVAAENAGSNRIRAEAYAADLESGDWEPISEKGGTRMVNPKTRESYFIPGKTIAEINSEIQAMHARTGQANVGLRRDELKLRREDLTNQWGMDKVNSEMAQRRVDALERRLEQQGLTTPDEQADAIGRALEALSVDPSFQDFIEGDFTGFGLRNVDPETFESPEYQDFLNALEEEVGSSLGGVAPLPGGRGRRGDIPLR